MRERSCSGIDICWMELTLRRTVRGEDKKQSSMLMLMSPETRVPATHPLRAIKKLADAALSKLSPVFDAMYASTGRPSNPPERLLKSMLLMALYTRHRGSALRDSRIRHGHRRCRWYRRHVLRRRLVAEVFRQLIPFESLVLEQSPDEIIEHATVGG